MKRDEGDDQIQFGSSIPDIVRVFESCSIEERNYRWRHISKVPTRTSECLRPEQPRERLLMPGSSRDDVIHHSDDT